MNELLIRFDSWLLWNGPTLSLVLMGVVAGLFLFAVMWTVFRRLDRD